MTGRYDVTAMGATTWDDYLTGYGEGYRHGIARGRELERDEVTALQRTAMETIHRLADLAERDHAADARRAELSRAWWAARRGEDADGMSTRAIAPVVDVSQQVVQNDIKVTKSLSPAPASVRETGEVRGEGESA
jgi:hypothetical protein